MSYKIKTITQKILADTLTPVSIYLKMRDMYPGAFLLESSDYHGNENSFSYICLQPVASFTIDDGIMTSSFPDGSIKTLKVMKPAEFSSAFKNFMLNFETSVNEENLPVNGLFGYSTYDAVKYFENIQLKAPCKGSYKISEVCYKYFKYVIAFNHFKNIMYIFENLFENEESQIDRIERLLFTINISNTRFTAKNNEISNLTDAQYLEMVTKGKESCYRGDVFQIVLSRQFSQQYSGDDFNLYRSLRSINPSPYLFYFDFGNYRIFGSSPEDQIKIKGNKAFINPIAGTFPRSGNDERDKNLAIQLAADPKEKAEHVMLVDLARNDLSRHGTDVNVEKYCEVQFYSHVLHMVSTVSAKLDSSTDSINMFMDTFPAGTLSGAPKYKAMQLIDNYENQSRGYYGGAIGYIGLDGLLNHAIMIRTFLSMDNTIYYQAGAGIVAASVEANELQEVKNKLGALKKAIEMAGLM
jgi:anthranilate synthase component 1